ncbi:MAG TPA: magnesium transporter CorA family protein [Solirubrobacterales bacterium]|nr:magnesium transporter CorA family protein [Solirubrobacterales bacterium]
MGEVIEGIAAAERERIAALVRAGKFFWVDVSLSQTSRDELGEALGIPGHALDRLVDFEEDTPPSLKFDSDGKRVVFAFSCFLDTTESTAGIPKPLRVIEVHVLISGDFILTLHEEELSLPERLAPDPPEGRSEQYIVYAILDAMVATGFDALNEAELTLEGMQLMSTDMRSSRVRMATLRAINSRLSRMRRRLGPQRGIFERISEEIGRIEGLQADSRDYFGRIYGQLNRLIDGIDAAGDGLAKLIDLRLNETIYWLTVVSTIFLPLTFVTGFFGMNFAWMIDEIDTPLAFILLGIGAPLTGAAVTLYIVRRRGTPIEPDRGA